MNEWAGAKWDVARPEVIREVKRSPRRDSDGPPEPRAGHGRGGEETVTHPRPATARRAEEDRKDPAKPTSPSAGARDANATAKLPDGIKLPEGMKLEPGDEVIIIRRKAADASDDKPAANKHEKAKSDRQGDDTEEKTPAPTPDRPRHRSRDDG